MLNLDGFAFSASGKLKTKIRNYIILTNPDKENIRVSWKLSYWYAFESILRVSYDYDPKGLKDVWMHAAVCEIFPHQLDLECSCIECKRDEKITILFS